MYLKFEIFKTVLYDIYCSYIIKVYREVTTVVRVTVGSKEGP